MRRELGDFQTPPALVAEVLSTVRTIFPDKFWTRVLEPTCGTGNFIAGLLALSRPPAEIVGFELQDRHLIQAAKLVPPGPNTRVRITKANIFTLDFSRDLEWDASGPLLVIGNPPWVTNAELGALGSDNLPEKSNFKRLSGIDARTGQSNFDIAEYIWLKLMRELRSDPDVTIALLCKSSTARNVLKHAYDTKMPLIFASIHRVDAKRWFNADIDACLFCVKLGPGKRCYDAQVYNDLSSNIPESVVGIADGQLVADLNVYQSLALSSGLHKVTWRQGIKHDAASVMELENIDGVFLNKLGEIVKVEPEYIYPLLKGSDLFNGVGDQPRRSVLVPQRQLGEDTIYLRTRAPLLWAYLTSHARYFEKRKSSIYKGQPPFAIFGIGEYTFAPFKVAIAGLYKTPRFYAVGTVSNSPIILDDTCYFVACASAQQATLLSCLLNSPTSVAFINSLIFTDSKRPITKKLLQQVDPVTLLKHVNQEELRNCTEREAKRLLKDSQEQQPIKWPSNLEELLIGL